MSQDREFEDGAFYWVRYGDSWTIGLYGSAGEQWSWEIMRPARYEGAGLTEVGPCIGKGPPDAGLDALGVRTMAEAVERLDRLDSAAEDRRFD